MKADHAIFSINGRTITETILDEECPTAVLYVENSDYSEEQSKGLTSKENEIEVKKRATDAYFFAWLDTLRDLQELDESAPETWANECEIPYSLILAIKHAASSIDDL